MQSVIDKLRDLSATKFSEKMAGTQTLTIGVTSGDNHRYEKVTINKDGDVYDAQRDGEPAVYVIDAKDIDDLQKAISGIKQLIRRRRRRRRSDSLERPSHRSLRADDGRGLLRAPASRTTSGPSSSPSGGCRAIANSCSSPVFTAPSTTC